MTLADLIGRGVNVEWHEAVAIIRDAIERSDIARSGAVPEFDEIGLLPFGEVEVNGGTHVEDPAQGLVAILDALINPQTLPAPFVDLIGEGDGSIEALSDALAYFERPDRVGILRSLYSRASGSTPLPDADELIASLRTALPAPTPASVQPERPPLNYRTIFYVVGALVLVGLSLIGFSLLKSGSVASAAADGSPSVTSRIAASVTGAADAVGDAVLTLGQKAGLGSGPRQEPATPPVEKASATNLTPSGPRRPRSPNDRAAAFPIPLPAGREFSMWSTDDVTKRANLDETGFPRETHVITASDPLDDVVYSAAALDVTPPVGLRPHLPKPSAANLKAENVSRIELIIRADGTVASVKLLGMPRNIHDSMLLSAAKTWRFRPATRGGIPVPYRTTIAVAR